jgi:hypothetical protein
VQKAGIKVKPEVMSLLVGLERELDLQAGVVHAAAKAVMAEQKVKLNYMVGTMIEVPRGALTADEIGQTAEYFSFGTNDLTQTESAGPVRAPFSRQEAPPVRPCKWPSGDCVWDSPRWFFVVMGVHSGRH